MHGQPVIRSNCYTDSHNLPVMNAPANITCMHMFNMHAHAFCPCFNDYMHAQNACNVIHVSHNLPIINVPANSGRLPSGSYIARMLVHSPASHIQIVSPSSWKQYRLLGITSGGIATSAALNECTYQLDLNMCTTSIVNYRRMRNSPIVKLARSLSVYCS